MQTPPPGIDPAPLPAPQRNDRLTFSDRVDAFVTWLTVVVSQFYAMGINVYNNAIDAYNNSMLAASASTSASASAIAAAASAASAVASVSTNGTSTTSLTLGAGSRTITTQTGKNWAAGMWINCVRTSDRSKSMSGYIDSYNSTTGVLVLIVISANISGTGTFTDWTLTVAGLPGSVLNFIDLSLIGPSIRPSLMCDFSRTKQLDTRVLYKILSSQTYFDQLGLLRTTVPGQACFDNDRDGKSIGLPLFEQRTNILLYSRDFSNAAWLKNNIIATLNQVGIDGVGSTASLLIAALPNGTVLQTVTASSTIRSVSAYVKRISGSGNIEMTLDGGLTWTSITGSISTTNYSRVTIPAQSVTNPSTGFRIANAGDSIAVDYIQNEDSGNVSPAIATLGVAVTRSAPSASISLGDWFNPLEGTLFVEYIVSSDNVSSVFPGAISLSDGSSSNYMSILSRTVDDTARATIWTGGVNQADLSNSSVVYGNRMKGVLAYKANDFAYSSNGALAVIDTAGTVPTVTRLDLGVLFLGTNILNGWICKVAYFPRRLTNAEIVALSTL